MSDTKLLFHAILTELENRGIRLQGKPRRVPADGMLEISAGGDTHSFEVLRQYHNDMLQRAQGAANFISGQALEHNYILKINLKEAQQQGFGAVVA